MIKTFEDGIRDKEWIVADKFTAADVMLGSSAVFLRAFNMLPESGPIEAYADRCLSRPAYQKALELQGD
jgi:glutathione S-transferase